MGIKRWAQPWSRLLPCTWLCPSACQKAIRCGCTRRLMRAVGAAFRRQAVPLDISLLGPASTSSDPRKVTPLAATPTYPPIGSHFFSSNPIWCPSASAHKHTIAAITAMLSLRSLARSAPRSAARFSTKAVRPQAFLRQTAAFQPAWAVAAPRLTASFSVSAARRQDSGSM